jgi:hypothetical protein
MELCHVPIDHSSNVCVAATTDRERKNTWLTAARDL